MKGVRRRKSLNQPRRPHIYKVTSHAKEKGIRQDPYLTLGNDAADKHAALGCEEYQEHELAEIVERHDIRSWMVQRRMMCIVKHFYETKFSEPEPLAGPKPTTLLNQAILEKGHEPKWCGHQFICQICGGTWGMKDRGAIASGPQCGGEYPWQAPDNFFKPFYLPKGSGIIFSGWRIHPSHSISCYRG